MLKTAKDVTKEELIKAISRECHGCMISNEMKIARCDCITCPFHQYRGTFINVDAILEDESKQKIFLAEEKKAAKKSAKVKEDLPEEKKKLTLKKKPKKGEKV